MQSAILAKCGAPLWLDRKGVDCNTETEMDVGGEAHQGGAFFFK